jgi:hypothetical protein
MMRALAICAAVSCCGLCLASIPLVNADIETNASGLFGPIDGWGPSGGWADHAGFPRPNDGTLGAAFGFYSVNNLESVGQITGATFTADTMYNFSSWGQGGANDVGTMVYEIGYEDPGTGDFVLLASANYAVGQAWQLLGGVDYMTGAAGAELGNPIWVRLGPSDGGATAEDVWFDNFSLTPEPTSLVLLALGGLICLRRR